MKVKKSLISKRLIFPFFSIFSIVAVIILSNVIFNHIRQNEQEVISWYQEKEQKCEMLKEIAEESIKEGIGIDIKNISNDEIQYRIYNDNEIIIYYYYLKDHLSNTKPMYNATITLDNKYNILQEEYSIEEVESFEEYVKMYNSSICFISIGYSLICMMFFYIIMYISYCVLKYCKNKKEIT